MTTRSGKILIMAGGTGGHVFPALSIARFLQERGVAVEWLGTRNGLEASVIPRAGIPIHYIRIGGLRGKSRWTRLLAPFAITVAIAQAIARLWRVKPDCVLGMGGFVTGPGGIAAWLLRRELIIHEQNAIAGFTNQLLFPFSTLVLQAFPGAFAAKRALPGHAWLRPLVRPERARTVGNPVRPEITAVAPPEVRLAGRQGPLRLLVIGGSLGAVAFNRAVPAALAALASAGRPQVLHQCGSRNLDDTLAEYDRHGLAVEGGIRVQAFVEDMAQAWSWADLVLCRAGALTVAEIACVGVASVLVPYPWAVDDHQRANAAVLEEAGAAIVLRDEAFDAKALLGILRRFQENRGELEAFARAARRVGQPDATETVGNLCLELCHA